MKEKNIRELAKRMGLITVENMCQYTITQLVVMVANKVNELVDEVWRFETDVQEIVKTQNENIQHLLGEGLHLEVGNIFDGWIQDGTFDTLINQSALKQVNDKIDDTINQISSVESKINKKISHFSQVNVKDFGAIGDGIADDTEAFKNAFNYDCIEIPSGTYRVTDTISFENKNVYGSNMTHVTILGDIEDATKPILAIGGQSVVKDITVSYKDGLLTGREGLRERVGIQLFGGWRNLPFQTGAGLYNCQISNCGTGVSDGGHSVFSANFKDLRISKFTCRGFEMTGSARTGNVYDNIYITNHDFTRNDGTGDTQKAWQGFVLSGEESECTITQLNVEHGTFYQAVIIEDVLGINIGSLHIEGVEPRDTYSGLVQIERTQGKIDNASFYFTRHKTGTSLIKFGETKRKDTENDFYSNHSMFEIGTLVCKGLNRPDRSTYGYEPNYPVSASTLSGSTQPFYFISREQASDKYFVSVNRFNWATYSYGFNDSVKYQEFNCNPHGSITFLKKPPYEMQSEINE